MEKKKKIDYKWKAWGFCSKCGFGSCKHLEYDRSKDKFYKQKLKELNKALWKKRK